MNCRRRSVEYRNRVAPVLTVAIHVGHHGAEQAVCLRPDLVGGTVVDAEGAGASPNVHPEGLPGERLLEDALAKVASKKQSIGPTSTEGSQEPQVGDSDVLCLVHDREVEQRRL